MQFQKAALFIIFFATLLTGCDEVNIPAKKNDASSQELQINGNQTVVLSGQEAVLRAQFSSEFTQVNNWPITWEQVAGPVAKILPRDDLQSVKFIVPDVLTDTDLTFKISTKNTAGDLLSKTFTVTAKQQDISFTIPSNIGGSPTGTDTQSTHTQKQANIGDTVSLTTEAKSITGEAILYFWEAYPDNPSVVTLSNANSQTATFTAPHTPGTYRFKVTATDASTSKSSSQTYVIEIRRQAFTPQTGTQHQVYNGHGSVAFTAETHGGTPPFIYQWTQIAGPQTTLSAVNTETVQVTPPDVSVDTDFIWQAEITDADGRKVITTHSLSVKATPVFAVNIVKGKDCSLNCLVEEGLTISPQATVQGGSGNYTFTWESNNPAVTISGSTTETPSFTMPNVNKETIVNISVTVNDGSQSTRDTLSYLVKPVLIIASHQNQPNSNLPTGIGSAAKPINHVESGSNYRPKIDIQSPPITGGATITYLWEVVSPNPAPSGLNIAGANTANPIVSAPIVSSPTPVVLKATVFGDVNGRTIVKTLENSFEVVPFNSPSISGLALSLAGHVDAYSGHEVQLAVTTMNASGALSYQWTQISGTAVTLNGSTAAISSFIAPNVSGHQDLVFEVEVADDKDVAKAQVTVAVDPMVAPAKLPLDVNTSPDEVVFVGNTVNPRVSISNAFGAISYAWTETTATGVSITGANTATPSFTAPNTPATITLEVTATDTQNGSETDTVTYHVHDVLSVTAGQSRTVSEGNNVPLLASVKNAVGAVTYTWSVISDDGTGINDGNINDTTSQATTLDISSLNVQGDKTITLQVTANDGTNTASANVSVLIQDRHMRVDVGADYIMPIGQPAYLHADVQGGLPPYSFNWSDDSQAPLSSTSSANPSLTAPSNAATLNYSLTVTDSLGNQAADAIVITTNLPKMSIDAGINIVVLENIEVNLLATAINGSVNTWQWTQISGTNVSLSNANTQSPSFTAPGVSLGTIEELVFEVSGTPATGLPAKDRVKVIVTSLPDITAVAQDVIVAPGKEVGLKGLVSDVDPNNPGTVTELSWEQVKGDQSGSVGPLRDHISTGPGRFLVTLFDAPLVTTRTDFSFIFTAKSTGNIVQIPVVVTVLPTPVVKAGSEIYTESGRTVQLSASATDATSYSWRQVSGSPTVTLTDADTASATFIAPSAPNCDVASTFQAPCIKLEFEVTATNASGTSTDRMTVNINKPKILIHGSGPRTIRMNESDTVELGVVFTLPDGTAVDPADVNIQWKEIGDVTNKLTFSNDQTEKVTLTAVGAASPPFHKVYIIARPKSSSANFTAAVLQYTVEVIKPAIPPLGEQLALQAALINKNPQISNLLDDNSGSDKAGNLHAPVITGGVPPYRYSWSAPADVTLTNPNSENPSFVITRPTNTCTYVSGSFTLTVTDSANQAVTLNLPYKLTREAATNVANSLKPAKCHTCRGPKFICERSHVETVCAPTPEQQQAGIVAAQLQYCINDVENLEDGSRYVIRRCATAEEVNKDWFEKSINADGKNSATTDTKGLTLADACNNYDVQNLDDDHYFCHFACKGDNCNIETDLRETPSRRLAIDQYPLPSIPANVPGSCPGGVTAQP